MFGDAARPRGHHEVLLQAREDDVAHEIGGSPDAEGDECEQRQGEVPEIVDEPFQSRRRGVDMHAARREYRYGVGEDHDCEHGEPPGGEPVGYHRYQRVGAVEWTVGPSRRMEADRHTEQRDEQDLGGEKNHRARQRLEDDFNDEPVARRGFDDRGVAEVESDRSYCAPEYPAHEGIAEVVLVEPVALPRIGHSLELIGTEIPVARHFLSDLLVDLGAQCPVGDAVEYGRVDEDHDDVHHDPVCHPFEYVVPVHGLEDDELRGLDVARPVSKAGFDEDGVNARFEIVM